MVASVPLPIRSARAVGMCLVAGLVLLNAAVAVPARAATADAEVERRAACITHEGGDLPASPGKVLPDPCRGIDLEAGACDDLDGAPQQQCFAREIALWDKVLDRLKSVMADRKGASEAVGRALAGFRTHREAACRLYGRFGINTDNAYYQPRCRLRLTIDYAKDTYLQLYSP